MIDHKITVCKRFIESMFQHRHDTGWRSSFKERKNAVKDTVKCIRRLRDNPTDKDLFDNPAYGRQNE